jgi:hypothetical protein
MAAEGYFGRWHFRPPSWPELLDPQHDMAPAVVTAQVCAEPGPVVGTGTR